MSLCIIKTLSKPRAQEKKDSLIATFEVKEEMITKDKEDYNKVGDQFEE